MVFDLKSHIVVCSTIVMVYIVSGCQPSKDYGDDDNDDKEEEEQQLVGTEQEMMEVG